MGLSWPLSSSVKSCGVRPVTGFPDLSRTSTSSRTNPWVGSGKGPCSSAARSRKDCCCAAADARTTKRNTLEISKNLANAVPRHLIATIFLPSPRAVVLRETHGGYRCAVFIFCSGDCLRTFQCRCRQSILDSRSKRFNVEVCISHGATLFQESFLDRVSWVPFQRSRSAARHERVPRQAASNLATYPVNGFYFLTWWQTYVSPFVCDSI